jgi:hypothetical protein
MREWLPMKHDFLQAVIERESVSAIRLCSECTEVEGSWKCTECFESRIFCNKCIRRTHSTLPLHRVKHWTGEYFKDTSLQEAGIRMHFGHHGAECPSHIGRQHLQEDSDDDIDAEIAEAPIDSDTEIAEAPIKKGEITVIDISGVHTFSATWCRCNNSIPAYQQALELGMYPASFKRVQTVFTFKVLDDYLLQNLECKTPAMNYFSLLRRRTNPLSPKSVKDRYRELLRVSRQWRHLMQLKKYGYGFGDQQPTSGRVATFCAACPQPEINLPDNWKDSDDQYVNLIYLIMQVYA